MLVGEGRGGSPVSLLGCTLLETRGVHGGRPTGQLIAVDRVLDGVALTRPDRQDFIGLVLQVETLTAWLHSAVVGDTLEEDRPWPQVQVQARLGSARLGDGLSVVLRRHRWAQFVSTSRHTVSWPAMSATSRWASMSR